MSAPGQIKKKTSNYLDTVITFWYSAPETVIMTILHVCIGFNNLHIKVPKYF